MNDRMSIWDGSVKKAFTNLVSMYVLIQVMAQLSVANIGQRSIRQGGNGESAYKFHKLPLY